VKIFRSIAVAALAALAIATPALAQNATTTAGLGDVTTTLGPNPYFPSGYKTSPDAAWYKQVTDSTANAPASVGQLLALSPASQTWALSNLPFSPIPIAEYGVVTSAAGAVKGSATIQVRGIVSALCTTNATQAIAAGSFLTADGAGNLTTLPSPSTPATPTVTPVGTTGAVTVTYGVVAISYDGVPSAISTAGSTSTSNANGSNANYNQVSWTPNGDAAQYVIVRVTATGYTPSTIGAIGIVPGSATTFNDTGLAIIPNTSATQFFQRPAAGGTPTVALITGGTAGTTTYSYRVTAIFPNGVWGAEGTAASNSTSNAVLSATNGNKLTWTATTGAVLYAIDRTAAGGTPSTTGFIGYATPAQATSGFFDIGQAATTFTAQTTPNPVPRPGAVYAVSLGALTSGTTTPTAVNVWLGGL
jgi:hypothetical protein